MTKVRLGAGQISKNYKRNLEIVAENNRDNIETIFVERSQCKLNQEIMVATGNLNHPLSPILIGKNYDVWSLKMITLLRSQYWLEVVITGFTKPDLIDLVAMTNAQ